MRLSTRLLLPLLATVVVVMVAYATWAQRQREDAFVAESERETRAYARALSLAVERSLALPERGGVQEIIDHVSREPSVYGVLVYDLEGAVVYASEAVDAPAALLESELRETLRAEGSVTTRRTLDGEPVIGVLRRLDDGNGAAVGVLEVAQSVAFAESEQALIRQRFLLNTLTLVLALSILVAWLVHRYVTRPLASFADAVRAFGEGRFGYRLPENWAGSELAVVAAELNRMAGRLEAARVELVREGEERVQLERRLRKSEEMATVGTLAAGLAHEIGAPLHVIRGRADLVLTQEPDAEIRDRNLRIIIDQIDRITLIVNNLLDYARRREPRRRATDPGTVLREVAGFLDEYAEGMEAEIELEITPEETTIDADPDLLHQVFLNVMLNALHEVEKMTGERRVRARVQAEAGAVVVLIEDTGPGVSETVRERMFEPFFTTKERRAGTGLGLAVAKGIVEDHGGQIEVLSTPEEGLGGATIRIELPTSGSDDGLGGRHG